MFKFGPYEIKEKLVLAPMAGITSFSYRKFMSEFGVNLTYTEMVSDMGLLYKNKETESYLSFPKSNFLTGVQLFGSDKDNIAKSVQICLNLCQNIDFFDVNMACPVPKVTRQGSGSALLKNPKKCGDIIREIKKVTSLPISAKIRLGFDNSHINFLDVISELEDAGVDMIAIHARTAKELYIGTPHFDLLKDLRKKMHVPLLVSGNIFTVEDAINALNITGADAVMIARGGVGNPLLIKQINDYFNKGCYENNYNFEDQKKYCLKLAKMLIEEKGEDTAMRVFRGIAPKFFASIPNCKKLRNRLSTEMDSYEDLENILNDNLG